MPQAATRSAISLPAAGAAAAGRARRAADGRSVAPPQVFVTDGRRRRARVIGVSQTARHLKSAHGTADGLHGCAIRIRYPPGYAYRSRK
eukprot:COSAG02_NODE_37006_length_447_cov_3.094828_1_plen_89_part_00